MRTGKDYREWATLRNAEQGGALGSRRVHDRANVIHSLRKGGRFPDWIRKAGASLIEDDEPTEGCQPVQELRQVRFFPRHIEMRHEAMNQHQIERPLTKDLVGDAQPPALRVPRSGPHGRSIPAEVWVPR
jgi:hypothetical protein